LLFLIISFPVAHKNWQRTNGKGKQKVCMELETEGISALASTQKIMPKNKCHNDRSRRKSRSYQKRCRKGSGLCVAVTLKFHATHTRSFFLEFYSTVFLLSNKSSRCDVLFLFTALSLLRCFDSKRIWYRARGQVFHF
jgi:hypothetical protein